MKRRFLVSAQAIRKDGTPTFFNSVIRLEPEERMNATAIDQIEKLLAGQHEVKTVTVMNFTQLEGAAPRYALHDRLLDAWMAANEYCTDNEIEGDDNAINLLVRDHALVKTERDHLEGLVQKCFDFAVSVREAGDLRFASPAAAEMVSAIVRIRKHLVETRTEVEEPVDV